MEKRCKSVVRYLSRNLLYQKIHPLRDAAFGADCLTPLRILKIITVSSKINSGTAIENCQYLICGPLKIKSLHLLSKFRGYIFNGLGEK